MQTTTLTLALCILCIGPALGRVCDLPFVAVGTQCLFVDSLNKGSWSNMELQCSLNIKGARLAKIDDATQLQTIIAHIYKERLNTANYWIGASDAKAEGDWVWTDGTSVPMGAPFWMYDCDPAFTPRPKTSRTDNCAILDIDYHYLFSDTDCAGTAGSFPYSPICEFP